MSAATGAASPSGGSTGPGWGIRGIRMVREYLPAVVVALGALIVWEALVRTLQMRACAYCT